MLNQFEVPEWVYLKEPQFVDCDEELLTPVLVNPTLKKYVRASIHGISIDSRMCELLEFADQRGMTLSQARDLRIRQVQGSLAEVRDKELGRYFDFLRGLWL